ncbi:unnamed protein product [Cercopithifilaria johnstoni]|uniref:Uncharacterized protein n=1 Tax=Cercopithifilaria johnstoni TaxID=2874296 RepID=A0A8J2MAG1_9BILA|nr:unnamed protein product [Cercopithifilaria johnstoni]
MMYPRKIHDDFLFDPRLEQYICVEIFPFCDDFYFYGDDQLVVPFPFISDHPFIKPPMVEYHEEMSEKDAEPSKKEKSDYVSYAYINRIIRPGYDLERNEEHDVQHFRQIRHWLHGVFAPGITYKYRVEQLPDNDD